MDEYIPGLLATVRLASDANGHRLVDAAANRELELSQLEAKLIKLWDGEMTAAQLCDRARARGMVLEARQVAVFMTRLASARFLSKPPPAGTTLLTAEAAGPELLSDVVPALRGDLVIAKQKGARGIVQVTDPLKARTFTIYDFELSIARMLDGRRTAGDVIDAASTIGITVTIESLRTFIKQMRAYRFIAESGEAPAQSTAWEARRAWSPEIREMFQSALRLSRQGKADEALEYLDALLQVDSTITEARELKDKILAEWTGKVSIDVDFESLHGVSNPLLAAQPEPLPAPPPRSSAPRPIPGSSDAPKPVPPSESWPEPHASSPRLPPVPEARSSAPRPLPGAPSHDPFPPLSNAKDAWPDARASSPRLPPVPEARSSAPRPAPTHDPFPPLSPPKDAGKAGPVPTAPPEPRATPGHGLPSPRATPGHGLPAAGASSATSARDLAPVGTSALSGVPSAASARDLAPVGTSALSGVPSAASARDLAPVGTSALSGVPSAASARDLAPVGTSALSGVEGRASGLPSATSARGLTPLGSEPARSTPGRGLPAMGTDSAARGTPGRGLPAAPRSTPGRGAPAAGAVVPPPPPSTPSALAESPLVAPGKGLPDFDLGRPQHSAESIPPWLVAQTPSEVRANAPAAPPEELRPSMLFTPSSIDQSTAFPAAHPGGVFDTPSPSPPEPPASSMSLSEPLARLPVAKREIVHHEPAPPPSQPEAAASLPSVVVDAGFSREEPTQVVGGPGHEGPPPEMPAMPPRASRSSIQAVQPETAPEPARGSKKKVLIAAGSALAVIAVVAGVLLRPVPRIVELDCEVAPIGAQPIVAPRDGAFVAWTVRPGARFTEKQPVAQLEAKELDAELAKLTGQLNAAAARLVALPKGDPKKIAKARAAVAKAQKALDAAASQRKKAEGLRSAAKRAAAMKKADRAEAAARADFTKAQAALEASTHEAEAAKLGDEKQRLEAAVAAKRAELDALTLSAPVAGFVSEQVKPGEAVKAGQTLGVVLSGKFLVKPKGAVPDGVSDATLLVDTRAYDARPVAGGGFEVEAGKALAASGHLHLVAGTQPAFRAMLEK